MDDPHGMTRVDPGASPGLQPPAPPGADHRLHDVRRAVGAEYEVLGEICELGEGERIDVAYLAQRRSSMQLDVLRLLSTLGVVEVLGTIGVAIDSAGETCPNCGTALRAGVRFCGNCRANLSTLRVAGVADALSIAEWLAAKAEASRHDFVLLGQLDADRMRARHASHPGTTVLLARSSSTSRIAALALERAATGQPAVLMLDHADALPGVVESLLEPPAPQATPVAVPIVPDEPPIAIATPPAPPEPAPPATPGTKTVLELPLWLRVAALALSGAAVIAAIAWLVSVISRPGDDSLQRDLALAARSDSIQRDSIRRDSIQRDSIRADSARRAVVAIDSATWRIGAGVPAGASITVDGQRVSGRRLRLAPGSYEVVASAQGYETARRTIVLAPGQSLTWPTRLARAPQPAGGGARPGAGTGAGTGTGPTVTASACTAAAQRKDWAQALALCSRGAESGDSEAQYRYGQMLEAGTGVRRNAAEAARLFRRAADRDHTGAQVSLGLMHVIGDGVPQSNEEAQRWLRRAATLGSARARQELAGRGW